VAEWTDKRMDDLADQVRDGFARVDGEIAKVREDVKETRAELRSEMQEGFTRVDKQFDRIDKQFDRIDKRFDRIDKRFERANRWALAIAVAAIGLLGADVLQGFGGDVTPPPGAPASEAVRPAK